MQLSRCGVVNTNVNNRKYYTFYDAMLIAKTDNKRIKQSHHPDNDNVYYQNGFKRDDFEGNQVTYVPTLGDVNSSSWVVL